MLAIWQPNYAGWVGAAGEGLEIDFALFFAPKRIEDWLIKKISR
jgi:hypothetical protein